MSLLYGILSVRTSIMVPQKCQYQKKSGSVSNDGPPKYGTRICGQMDNLGAVHEFSETRCIYLDLDIVE